MDKKEYAQLAIRMLDSMKDLLSDLNFIIEYLVEDEEISEDELLPSDDCNSDRRKND